MREAKAHNRVSSRPRLRVLFVEDNPLDVELMVALLKRVGYSLSFTVVELPEQLQEKLQQEDYDVILSDYNLRTWNAMDALEITKKFAKDVPFVVVTGALGDEAAVECIKQGATDYVLKHRLQRLPVVVETALREKAHREEAARLQEEIHRAKKEWELTFDTVPDPIFIVDRHCRIQRANRAASDLLGMGFAQLVGQSYCELVYGEAAPGHDALCRRRLAASREEGGDVEVPRLGKIFYSTASPLRDPDEHPPVCVHVLHDITKRKRAEEVLRFSEANYRSLILGATYGIFRCSVDGKFLTVNPALVAMLGYGSEAELLRANLLSDISQDNDPGTRLLQHYRETGRIDGVEAQWKRKDGTPILVRFSGRAVLDGQGMLQGFEVIVEDVTERKRLEEQLRQAQKMEAIGQLAGGVAHDFNNLLTIITGYGQILLDRLESDDLRRGYVKEIKDAGERAAALTRQLLAFSRRQVLAPRVLNLNAVINNLDKMLRRLIGEDIDLVTVCAEGLGRVKADLGQLEQVILNLALNARDAMPRGGRLTLETANAVLDEAYTRAQVGVTPGHYVMVAVSDTGCGMDGETQAHIFEPFFTTKEQGKGTGLGLATVYGIVTQSGGHIEVHSELGQGTTFKIYLPQVDDDTEQAVKQEEEMTAAARGAETILVVEDEAEVRALVRGLLASRGYTVLEARRGDLALQIAQQHQGPIHLLLTDVVMPGMSGRELAERLETLHPETMVLYMSGYTDDAILHHGALEPGTAFLQKPFAPDALAQKVREVLDVAREKQA